MSRAVMIAARHFLADLLEQCDGQLFTAVDLSHREPNELGRRALHLIEQLDDVIQRTPDSLGERLRGLMFKGRG